MFALEERSRGPVEDGDGDDEEGEEEEKKKNQSSLRFLPDCQISKYFYLSGGGSKCTSGEGRPMARP